MKKLEMTDKEKIEEACAIIRWFVENDETNQGDEPLEQFGGDSWDDINAYYIEGLRKANKFLRDNDTVELPW